MLNTRFTDVVGWLGYCFTGYIAYLVIATVWKRERPKHAERWMKFLAHLRKAKEKTNKGVATYGPIGFAAICCAVMLYGAARMENAPIAEEHNVAVLASVGPDEWRMRSDEEGEFVYRACPDFDNASVIWVGYIADRAKWREYGRCKSIRDTGLGFYWRVGHNEWRKVD